MKNRTNNKILMFLVFIFFMLVFSNLYAKRNINWVNNKHSVKFEHITTEQGLSQSSVLCILQDSKGFMWFGTEDGLNRYDGYNFQVYRPNPENPYSINSNRIFSIYEDRSGILWIGTNGGGLNKFDHLTERFFHYRNDWNTYSISDDNISAICEDRAGNLWFGTVDEGLNKLTPINKEKQPLAFIKYRHDPKNPKSLSNNNITSIFEDREGVLWIGTKGGGLNKLVPGEDKNSSPVFIHYQNDLNGPGTLSFRDVMAVNEDLQNMLWIGTNEGLYKFNRKKGKFTHYKADQNNPKSLSHNFVHRIYRDRVNMLWIGTDGGGLNKLIPSKNDNTPSTFVRYQYDPNNKDGLNSNAIESIFEDRSGVLWIGGYTGGLNKLILRGLKGLNREKAHFLHIKHNSADPENTISHDSINTIWEDRRGALWIGTDGGGINKIMPADSENSAPIFFHYMFDPNNPNSISNNVVTSFYEDHLGIIWIGTYLGGLNKLVPKDNKDSNPKFIHYKFDPQDPNSISNNFVYSICEDHLGILWFGTIGGGLNRFDRKKETFTHFKSNPDNPNSISADYIMTIYKDSSNILWIGTTYGLNRFIQEENKFIHYINDRKDPNSISSNFINSIFEDKSGVLWIGTDGGGLNKLIPSDQKGSPARFIHYTKKDGLPNDVILDILQDNEGNLWLSTNNGLSKFFKEKGTFKNYDVGDGLQGNEFNDGAAWKGPSGEIFFGGDNGINIFQPEELKENLYVPPIVITDFQIFNQSIPVGEWKDGVSILKKSIIETTEIKLSYRFNIFSFQFAALNYISTGKNQYTYRMEGLEKEWNYGTRRFVTYTTLPPGDYVFRVKGSNNDGIWNEKGTFIRIKIIPPFWKTWWFQLLLIILSILIVLTLLKIRTYNIKKRNIQLKESNVLLNKQIAERKKAEMALIESEAKYRSLFVNIPNPILIFHRETKKFLDCNQATVDQYGYALEELRKMTLYDLHFKKDLKKKKIDIKDIEHNSHFYTHVTKRGERLQVDVHTAPVEYKKQNAYIAIVRDITKQKQLEQQLYQAQKMDSIGKLAGGIAHDFNNLLTAIIGHAELALMKMEKNNPLSVDIEAVLTGGRRASNLISQLLTFSKKQIIKPKIIDINSLIYNLDKMLRRFIGEDIGIEKILKSNIMCIKADPGQIEQILVNLVINARDAINEQTEKLAKKKITIETNQIYLDESYIKEHIEIDPGLYTTITVSDTGIGMNEEIKGKIFDPFFTTKKEGEGTGLGMSTVYGIVKQNHGNIHIYSEVGKGTTIKIYWPATDEKATIDIVEKPSKNLLSGLETILFVEDDESVMNFAVSALKELGYKVFAENTGKKALALIKEKKLDLNVLITDLIMPEINGKELADKIKKIFPSIHVIITSGYPDSHLIQIEELDKDVHFLQKPYSIQSLINKISEALNHSLK